MCQLWSHMPGIALLTADNSCCNIIIVFILNRAVPVEPVSQIGRVGVYLGWF